MERLPAAVEATAYFVVAEALTNVAKHAQCRPRRGRPRSVEDDTLVSTSATTASAVPGPTGAASSASRDRLAVLDGRLRVESPADGGTLVDAAIPLGNGA